MPIEMRGDRVCVIRLLDDPQFTADLQQLAGQMPAGRAVVVLDFAGVRYLNSSNLARLLRLRKDLIEAEGKVVLCGMPPQVQGVFRATGLDRVFVIARDLPGADALVAQP